MKFIYTSPLQKCTQIFQFSFSLFKFGLSLHNNSITLIKHTVGIIIFETLFFMHRKFTHFYNTSLSGQLQNKTSLYNIRLYHGLAIWRGCLVESIFHIKQKPTFEVSLKHFAIVHRFR